MERKVDLDIEINLDSMLVCNFKRSKFEIQKVDGMENLIGNVWDR